MRPSRRNDPSVRARGTREKTRVLVLGGGYVGLYTAWGLERHPDIDVTVIEPNSYMTYYPLLPEVAAALRAWAISSARLRSAAD